jgi:hypothetical protein
VIKMIAYVGAAPIRRRVAGYMPKRRFFGGDGPGQRLQSPLPSLLLISSGRSMLFNNRFVGTVIGFLAPATLIALTRSPSLRSGNETFYGKTNEGIRILLALNVSIAVAGAMVIVNTVVLVRGTSGQMR